MWSLGKGVGRTGKKTARSCQLYGTETVLASGKKGIQHIDLAGVFQQLSGL